MDIFISILLQDLQSDLYYTVEYLIWLMIFLGAFYISGKFLLFLLNQ